jgi:hypothetical protein
MRRPAIALAAAVLIGAVSAASAADLTGTIKSIDATAKTVTLNNGDVFKWPSSFSAAGFKVGEKVKVTYTGTGSSMMASEIQKAS